MSLSSTSTNKTVDAICPFCALLCDDLRVQARADGSLTLRGGGCARAVDAFARRPAPPTVQIAGSEGSLAAACAAVARHLKRARQPLIAGLASDVDGTRAAVDLAEACGAILDHVHGDALAAVSSVLQQRGYYATTLSEVRSRADFVLVLDVDFGARYENFARRCLEPAPALRRGSGQGRTLAWLGRRQRAAALAQPDYRVDCRADGLGESLTALLALLRGAPLDAPRSGGARTTALRALAEAMRGAAYCAVVIAPGQLEQGGASALAAAADVVDELNREGRAAVLTLGGDEGGQSAVATTAWLTGYPLRCALGRDIRYEPTAFRTADLLANGAVDALLWIDAYGTNPLPPAGLPPAATVVLGNATPTGAKELAAFIGVGTPGLDHQGRLLRSDSVVSLALPALRDLGRPSVAAVLREIRSHW